MYRRVLGRFSAFCHEATGRSPTLADLNLDTARRHLVDLRERPRYEAHPFLPAMGQLPPATVAQHARCLRAFASWLRDEGFSEDHRLQRLRLPKAPTPELRPLSVVEVERLLGVFDPASGNDRRNAAIVGLLLDTGMRTGELVGLTRAVMDFASGEIRVLGKGEKRRTVVIGKRGRGLLRRYLDHRREGRPKREIIPALMRHVARESYRLPLTRPSTRLTNHRSIRTLAGARCRRVPVFVEQRGSRLAEDPPTRPAGECVVAQRGAPPPPLAPRGHWCQV